MKINIVYFTSTGNTLWLSEKAKGFFEQAGHQVQLFEVVKTGDSFLKTSDMVGIFYPVWASNLPNPLRDMLNTLEDGSQKGKKMFLIGNCAMFTGDTGMYWKRILERKGFNVFYINHLVMPTNLNVPNFNFQKVPDEKKKTKILKKAEQKLKKICADILADKNKKDGISPLGKFMGWGQRNFYEKGTEPWKNLFSVNKKRCTGCRLCYRMCPVGNIKMQADAKPSFGSKCILCVKCYNLCPANAILIGEKSEDSHKYRRYKGPSKKLKPTTYR